VVYLEERPSENEGPFLSEERNLINMVSEMLRIFFVRREAAELLLKEKDLSDSVINSMPGIFYFCDHTGRFIRWNKRFETVSGYTSDEINRMQPLDFFEGADKEHIKERIREVIEKGTSDAEALFLTKSGRKIPYYFTASAVRFEDELCLIGIGMDISARKQAEKEMQQLNSELRRLPIKISRHIQKSSKTSPLLRRHLRYPLPLPISIMSNSSRRYSCQCHSS